MKNKQKLISAAELVERTGASYRQIDYWCTAELLVPADNVNNPGSGHYRKFDENLVNKVQLLVTVSDLLSNSNRMELFKKIHDAYDEGEVNLGNGIMLLWGCE